MARKATTSSMQTFGLTTTTPVVRLVGPSGTVLREITQPMYAYKGQLVVQARKALWPVSGAEGTDVAIVDRATPVATLPAGTKRADVQSAIAAMGATRVTLAQLGVAKQPKAAKPAKARKAQQPKAAKADIPSMVASILADASLSAEERVAAINALATA